MSIQKNHNGFCHELSYEGETNDWITPKWIFDIFNKYAEGNYYFDLDPCSSMTQPWKTSRDSYTIKEDGLKQDWHGNVWCNPPYGPHTQLWVRRLIEHGNGVALIFARVETILWQEYILPTAYGILFPKGRIAFSKPDGTPSNQSSAPSAFIAWGDNNKNILKQLCQNNEITGAYFDNILCTYKYERRLF